MNQVKNNSNDTFKTLTSVSRTIMAFIFTENPTQMQTKKKNSLH